MVERISEMDCNVLVIGGGAAGLCAAISAAESGARTVVLEKNRRPGVKILISGGTRCNITNARGLRSLRGVTGPIHPDYDSRQAQGARSIQAAFGVGGKFLGPALRAFSVERTVDLFESQGVATKIESNGKIFPASDRAKDVLDALIRRLERSGATLRCNSPVNSITPMEKGFCVGSPDGTLKASRVILSVGGRSYPGCGTTGDGYAISAQFGHSIIDPRPALVPLRVKAQWVLDLKGLTLPDIVATIVSQSGEPLIERREAMLFAHFGLTGPAILDVSRAVTRLNESMYPMLSIDLFPGIRFDELDRQIQETSRLGRKTVANLVPAVVPRRLADILVQEACIPEGRISPDFSREERKQLVMRCKALRIALDGTLGFSKAEVTSGGVAIEEVEARTMQSKSRPGLFFAGEVLDLDGLIGGYNFQAAWSTGWLAGLSASSSLSSQGSGG